MSSSRVTIRQRLEHLISGRLTGEEVEVWREGITMSLYISLSQLAVISALPDATENREFSLPWAIALTSIGLVLAHQVAFRMSSRLLNAGSKLHDNARQVLVAQFIGGALVTLLALIPALILGDSAYFFSLGALFIYVMTVGYLIARSRPTSRIRALGYVGSVALAVAAILFVKGLIDH
jgi:MFS family permease